MRKAKAAESTQQHCHQGSMHHPATPPRQGGGGGGECHKQNQRGQFMGGGHGREVVDEQPPSEADNAARAACARLKRDTASRRLHDANVSISEVWIDASYDRGSKFWPKKVFLADEAPHRGITHYDWSSMYVLRYYSFIFLPRMCSAYFVLNDKADQMHRIPPLLVVAYLGLGLELGWGRLGQCARD